MNDALEKDIFSSFRTATSVFNDFPEEEWNFYKSQMKISYIKKDEYLIRPGERADFYAFIYQGVFKRFVETYEGRNLILSFDAESRAISDYASLISETPSNIYIQAIEDSVVLISSFGLAKKLRKRHPCWEEGGRVLTELRYVEMFNRTLNLLKMNATERYILFCETHKDISHRILQKDIASYLGVSESSLSRIRREAKLSVPSP